MVIACNVANICRGPAVKRADARNLQRAVGVMVDSR